MIEQQVDLEKNIELNWYQDIFMFAEERFSAIMAAVGTGKTFAGLLKAWNYCKTYPNSLGLIVRREYVDLKSSTIKDFEMNFGVTVGADKCYKFENGSVIMFTHGDMADINVLKNINLSFFIIEQAEEYETADIFDFLRDRLRRKGGPRWGSIIANANGHNWAYDRFIGQAKATVHNAKTGEMLYKKDRYLCTTANSFANAHNLPEDFIDDLKAMETEAYNHYMQFVMNDFNIIDADDLVFTPEEIQSMKDTEIIGNVTNTSMGADVARFGKDKCSTVYMEEIGGFKINEIACDSWGKKDATYTIGRIAEFGRKFRVREGAVDCDGLGGPMYDTLKELVGASYRLKEFRNLAIKDNTYVNVRTKVYFLIKDLASKRWIHISSPEILNDLATLRYMYRDNKKMMVPKEVLRAKGIPSPDKADGFMMGVWALNLPLAIKKTKPRLMNRPQEGIEVDY